MNTAASAASAGAAAAPSAAAGPAAAGPAASAGAASAVAAGRVLVAKVGLDGHDRGVKVVARMLRDAGFEVIYLGLRQTPDSVATAALQEDVDLVGLSMHSGGHLTLAPAVVNALRGRGLTIPVVVGGIVPERDVKTLHEAGVVAVLSPGASRDEVVAAVRDAISQRAR
jgi:methylmalonyl-CoA mutase cobalamin-binding domain/chain